MICLKHLIGSTMDVYGKSIYGTVIMSVMIMGWAQEIIR